MPRMIHLMPAIAGSKANVLRFLHNMGRPFIVKDVVRFVVGKDRLLDIYPSKACLCGKE